jgi:hypothetical protein
MGIQHCDLTCAVPCVSVHLDGCGIAMELLDHTRTIDQIITAGRHDIHT